MSWLDDAEDDLRSLVESEDDGGVPATITPHELGASTTDEVWLLLSAPSAAHIAVDLGEHEERRAEAVAYRAAVCVALELATGSARDLQRGDRITIADGAWSGEWVCESDATVDGGGGLVVSLISPRRSRVGGSRGG